MHRATFRYHSHRDPRTELRIRIREIAQARVRYGYRKILVLLRREGWTVGKYLVERIYREEGLTLQQRRNVVSGAIVIKTRFWVPFAPGVTEIVHHAAGRAHIVSVFPFAS